MKKGWFASHGGPDDHEVERGGLTALAKTSTSELRYTGNGRGDQGRGRTSWRDWIRERLVRLVIFGIWLITTEIGGWGWHGRIGGWIREAGETIGWFGWFRWGVHGGRWGGRVRGSWSGGILSFLSDHKHVANRLAWCRALSLKGYQSWWVFFFFFSLKKVHYWECRMEGLVIFDYFIGYRLSNEAWEQGMQWEAGAGTGWDGLTSRSAQGSIFNEELRLRMERHLHRTTSF